MYGHICLCIYVYINIGHSNQRARMKEIGKNKMEGTLVDGASMHICIYTHTYICIHVYI